MAIVIGCDDQKLNVRAKVARPNSHLVHEAIWPASVADDRMNSEFYRVRGLLWSSQCCNEENPVSLNN
jgi:hypothetical protein